MWHLRGTSKREGTSRKWPGGVSGSQEVKSNSLGSKQSQIMRRFKYWTHSAMQQGMNARGQKRSTRTMSAIRPPEVRSSHLRRGSSNRKGSDVRFECLKAEPRWDELHVLHPMKCKKLHQASETLVGINCRSKNEFCTVALMTFMGSWLRTRKCPSE